MGPVDAHTRRCLVGSARSGNDVRMKVFATGDAGSRRHALQRREVVIARRQGSGRHERSSSCGVPSVQIERAVNRSAVARPDVLVEEGPEVR
jgi:hypothetical protein